MGEGKENKNSFRIDSSIIPQKRFFSKKKKIDTHFSRQKDAL
jgi:hypothetical protein